MDQENSFQWGIFFFLTAGKLTFFGGGYNFKTVASDHPGAYTSMPHPFFGAKDVCYIEKGGQKKSRSWPSELALLCLMWHTHIHDIEKMVMVAKL